MSGLLFDGFAPAACAASFDASLVVLLEIPGQRCRACPGIEVCVPPQFLHAGAVAEGEGQ